MAQRMATLRRKPTAFATKPSQMSNPAESLCLGTIALIAGSVVAWHVYQKWSRYALSKREKWLLNRGWFITTGIESGQTYTRISKSSIVYYQTHWSGSKDYPADPIYKAYGYECTFGNTNPIIDRLCAEEDQLNRRLDRLAKEEALNLASNLTNPSNYDKEFPFLSKRIEDIHKSLHKLTKFKNE
jgi:hypothetical protein